MRRVEIVFSQAIDEEFLTACAEKRVGKAFTKVQGVQGQGLSDPKQGDTIWPQLNNLYVIYCEKKEADILLEIIVSLRKRFPTEGLSFFISSGEFSAG